MPRRRRPRQRQKSVASTGLCSDRRHDPSVSAHPGRCAADPGHRATSPGHCAAVDFSTAIDVPAALPHESVRVHLLWRSDDRRAAWQLLQLLSLHRCVFAGQRLRYSMPKDGAFSK